MARTKLERSLDEANDVIKQLNAKAARQDGRLNRDDKTMLERSRQKAEAARRQLHQQREAVR